MKHQKSAIIESKYCPCGALQLQLNLAELIQKRSHNDTLLHMAELLDELCHAYVSA